MELLSELVSRGPEVYNTLEVEPLKRLEDKIDPVNPADEVVLPTGRTVDVAKKLLFDLVETEIVNMERVEMGVEPPVAELAAITEELTKAEEDVEALMLVSEHAAPTVTVTVDGARLGPHTSPHFVRVVVTVMVGHSY